MRTRKLLSGLGAAVMSLMMIIPWAVYADSPQVEDSKITKNNTLMLYPYGKSEAFYPSGCCQADFFMLFWKKSQTEVLQ